MTRSARDSLLLLFLRLFTGLIFLYAPVDKILHPGGFSDSVWNYHLLPQAMVNPWALWLPWLELLSAILILSGVWARQAALLVNILFVLFLVAIGQGLARGIDFDCGCFSQNGHGSAASLRTVLRDVFFFAMSLWLLRRENDRSSWSLVREIIRAAPRNSD
jgi:uncharacterized membrane protein YphA (DoxX/SURF4 family)